MLFDRFENGFKKRFDRHLADMKNMEIPKAAKSYEKSSFSYEKLLFSVAAEEGFEPSQTESESVVLPLHNSAIHNAALPCDLYSIHREWLCVKLFFQENKKCFMQTSWVQDWKKLRHLTRVHTAAFPKRVFQCAIHSSVRFPSV